MPEREARARAVYDHDTEEPRPSGRRRRQVADWGVGEELFDGMPGRRFERRPHVEIPRGDAADGRRTIVIDTEEGNLPPDRAASVDAEFTSRDDALRAREADDALWGGDEPFAEREPEPVAETDLDAPAEYDGVTGRFSDEAYGLDEGEAQPGNGVVRGTQTGRRTVKIGGRPEFYGPPARARQRPPRSFHERLGPRPERFVAWAFALGMLLILIAILTANA